MYRHAYDHVYTPAYGRVRNRTAAKRITPTHGIPDTSIGSTLHTNLESRPLETTVRYGKARLYIGSISAPPTARPYPRDEHAVGDADAHKF